MMFVVHRFHQHWLLTLKCVLLLTADTNSATMISNSFIPPIKLKHCLRKCVSHKLPCLSNFVSTIRQPWFQILLFHLLNSSIACGNVFHTSYLACQILWAQSVSFPAVMNIRLTNNQRRWQSPTHSVDLPRVVMRVVMHQVRVKTMCDVTRIIHDSSIFS